MRKMKMVRRTQGVLLAALVTGSMILGACGGKKAAENNDLTLNKDEVVKDVIKYPIPSPTEITNALKAAKAGYISSLCNPVEKVDLYITDKDKALNLGVYGANLSYSSTYGMKQETLNYLRVSKRLIDELQISTQFNAAFAGRIQRNIDNRDSLTSIISNSFFDTYSFLKNNGKDYLSILVMMGSWVEGLYTTVEIAKSAPNNSVFLRVIANQKRTLDKLLELMEQNKESKNVEDSMRMLYPIKKAYETVSDEKLTQAQFENIVKAVGIVRQEIVM